MLFSAVGSTAADPNCRHRWIIDVTVEYSGSEDEQAVCDISCLDCDAEMTKDEAERILNGRDIWLDGDLAGGD